MFKIVFGQLEFIMFRCLSLHLFKSSFLVSLIGAAAASAQPIERESDFYVAAQEPYTYASVYTSSGVTPACPDEDDTLSFGDALKTKDQAQMEYYVLNRECLAVFDGSHGKIIGATIGGSAQFRVRFDYLHKYNVQAPLELYIERWDLRGAGGRNDRLDAKFDEIISGPS